MASDLGPPKAVYDYEDESGKRLFQVVRFEPIGRPKQFRQRIGPDQEKWSIKGAKIVPYRLPELIADVAAGREIYIVEGEKDVDTLRRHGIAATCNPGGAKKWRAGFDHFLKGASVVVCGDNDAPGRDHAQMVARSLCGTAGRLRVLDLKSCWPDIEESDDVSDFLDSHTVDQLREIVASLADWKPAQDDASGADAGGGKQVIEVDKGQIARMIDQAEAALVEARVPILVRGGGLVRPVVDTFVAADGIKTQATILKAMGADNITYALNKHAAVF